MYGAVSLARNFLLTGQGDMARLGMLIGVGALAYGVVSLAINRKGVLEVLATVRSIAVVKHQH
jgi:hypothetical protein